MLKEKVRVYRLRESARLPLRAHDHDAGMDFFFAPENNEPVVLQPNQSAVLGTGLKIGVPEGHMLQIMNKSGVASKRQLITGACVVDCGYNGELFVNLQNIGTTEQVIEPGTKLAQGVFIPISSPILVEIDEDVVYSRRTARGAGGFGSTGE